MVAISSSSHLPHPSIKPASPALQVESLPLSHQGSPRQLKMDFHDCDWWCCWCRWYICLPLLTGVFPQSAQVMRTGTHMSGIGQHCGITAYHSAWYIKLALKQHRTELLRCPDTQIFFPHQMHYYSTSQSVFGWFLRCRTTQRRTDYTFENI